MLVGKQNLGFADKFYPEDLPQEWQLDYYANNFDCILLENLSNLDIQEFIDDLENGFYLILEFNSKNIALDCDEIIFWYKCSDTKEAQKIINAVTNISIQSDKLLDIELPFVKIDNEFIYYNKKAIFLTTMPEDNKLISQAIQRLPNDICLITQTDNSEKLNQIKIIMQLLGF